MNRDFTSYQYVNARAEATRAGLRSFMLRVYAYMGFGLLLTAFVSVAVYNFAVEAKTPEGVLLTGFGQAIYTSWLRWVILLAPLGMVFFISARAYTMSSMAAEMSFWTFAGLMGLSLSSILVVYEYETIYRIAFLAAAMFGTMSLYGYATKRDLSSWGGFLTMALFGLILAFVLNWFIGGETLALIISMVGVVIFCGLTAYETNRLKRGYGEVFANGEMAKRLAINGALGLYLSFINIMLLLLSIFDR